MAASFTSRKRLRKSFGKIPQVVDMPNLIEVQRNSCAHFLQMDIPHAQRLRVGLHEVFQSIFPIADYANRAQLEYVSYDFDAPKYDVEECQQRGITFACPLRLTLRLVVWDLDEDTGVRSIRDIKEQEVYVGDIPLMTENGTFVVNGTERVIVSQMHRSPGVFFDHDNGKSHASGKYLYNARVIPYRGSWLDFEFDAKDILYVRIDRRRKLPVTTFLMCLDNEATAKKRAAGPLAPYEAQGMSALDILNTFYTHTHYTACKGGWQTSFVPEKWRGVKLIHDLVDAKTGEVRLPAGTKMTPRLMKELEKEKFSAVFVSPEALIGGFLALDIIDEATGIVLADAGQEIDASVLALVEEKGLTDLYVLDIDYIKYGPHILNTVMADKNYCREEALADIYRVMRPGEPPTYEAAEALLKSLFFDEERYDLSAVGRVKLNARLGLNAPDTVRILQKDDIIEIVRTIINLKDGRGEVDDIDHLGNRRVRSVGELIENQYRLGLLRMERAIKERMGAVELETAMPHDLVNAKPVVAAVKEFFGSSQLSQFMDQTNPLSEITHKRRLSALGPGGLTRERAWFEVRDVHPTHYGRICPIETPEGPNIGLINSLATFSRINRYGFIESPYRKVIDGKVSNVVDYLSALEESRYTIAQSNAALNAQGGFVDELITCRKAGEFMLARREDIDYIDVSPKQLVSVAASLIPFLENDDANRALMGSNMQRQAVPLLRSEAPLVGTGMEAVVARDSGVVVVARRDGVVDRVDAERIVLKTADGATGVGVDIYNLRKFQRSNQDTCINQKPVVKVGDVIKKGDIIADGPSTDLGELALGRNVLCAFMPWNGYNFEDSILLSERIVRDDVFTSIHIEEFEVMARDTKLGQEDITRDVPDVGEEALRNLDEAGIVYVGAEVKPGDILVGKVTPKAETPSTPEEKLLRSIFGEKASDVRDTSLRLPPGVAGTVVEVRIFSRTGIDKDERAVALEQAGIDALARERDTQRRIIETSYYDRLASWLTGQVVEKATGAKRGQTLDAAALDAMPKNQWSKIVVQDAVVMDRIATLNQEFEASLREINARFNDKVDKLQRGDDLQPGVMKMIKVFVAVKRKIQPGDKMAGRHGNKGVVSRIMPLEDMPFLEDGTPVDIVLNPLGVPSRMNVGQILETHLSWASGGLGRQVAQMIASLDKDKGQKEVKAHLKTLYPDAETQSEIEAMNGEDLKELCHNLKKGVPMATPVFDGAKEAEIVQMLEKAGLNGSGQVILYDGRTGEKFDRPVTVGYIYMLKLHHLVDDKIHARSIGPYSLVTQQPLGGKAQFGGQRFGEMEVWALQAYGAAYTLQEMLTIKSDDVAGRTKVYESIVKGDATFQTGIPESFNVLVKEIRALGLNIELKQSDYLQAQETRKPLPSFEG